MQGSGLRVQGSVNLYANGGLFLMSEVPLFDTGRVFTWKKQEETSLRCTDLLPV